MSEVEALGASQSLRWRNDKTQQTESALQCIVDVLRKNTEEKRLIMNEKNMKTMVVCCDETPDVRKVVNGQVLEQVKKFKYLGQ